VLDRLVDARGVDGDVELDGGLVDTLDAGLHEQEPPENGYAGSA
jgi:hypothetical protein